MALIQWTHTEAILRQYAEEVSEIYKRQLKEHGREASGELIKSVKTEIVLTHNDTIAVDMELAQYWQYVEWDTRPHWAPKGCLEEWIKVRKLLPMKNSTLPENKQLEALDFLIRRKIAREGTKGTHDLADTVSLLNKEYEDKIADAVVEDVAEQVDVIIRTFARA